MFWICKDRNITSGTLRTLIINISKRYVWLFYRIYSFMKITKQIDIVFVILYNCWKILMIITQKRLIFHLSTYKQRKIFQKQCLVLCSLKNLKLFPDIDSFMGVVFHGWIVSTITETNYIFRMLQLVSFLHSLCNILFQRIYYIAQANYWVCSRYCVK